MANASIIEATSKHIGGLVPAWILVGDAGDAARRLVSEKGCLDLGGCDEDASVELLIPAIEHMRAELAAL